MDDDGYGLLGTSREDPLRMRTFDTGSYWNIESDPDYHGFFSPLAMHN